MAFIKTFIKWEETGLRTTPIQWDSNPYKWDEVFIIEEIAAAGGAGPEEMGEYIKKLDRNKRKKIIRLVCKIEGKEYKEQKVVKENAKVTLKHIEIILKEAKKLGIEVKVKN